MRSVWLASAMLLATGAACTSGSSDAAEAGPAANGPTGTGFDVPEDIANWVGWRIGEQATGPIPDEVYATYFACVSDAGFTEFDPSTHTEEDGWTFYNCGVNAGLDEYGGLAKPLSAAEGEQMMVEMTPDLVACFEGIGLEVPMRPARLVDGELIDYEALAAEYPDYETLTAECFDVHPEDE